MKIGVYSPNWIGDAVMALPFIHHLKEKNPESEIIIICRDWVAAVYKNHPEIDQIITISRSDIKGYFATRQIGKSFQLLELDVFYTLTDSFRSAAILGWSKAKIRIGFKSQMRSIFLTDVIENPKEKMHRSIKYLTLINIKIKADNSIGIKLTNGEIQWANEEFKNLKLKCPIAFFPFSVASSRSIPNNKIKELLNGLNQSVLILGSKGDVVLANSLINECPGIKLINLCGKYSMRESMALISLCQFALASDSGLGHISASLGIPTISLFGAGDSEKTKPIGRQTFVINKNVHCSPCQKNICMNTKDHLCCFNEILQIDVKNAIQSLNLNP
ncbi:MAG: lipopolysaccharide heptosyltransferase II [Fidelibacterota bacterium]